MKCIECGSTYVEVTEPYEAKLGPPDKLVLGAAVTLIVPDVTLLRCPTCNDKDTDVLDLEQCRKIDKAIADFRASLKLPEVREL